MKRKGIRACLKTSFEGKKILHSIPPTYSPVRHSIGISGTFFLKSWLKLVGSPKPGSKLISLTGLSELISSRFASGTRRSLMTCLGGLLYGAVEAVFMLCESAFDFLNYPCRPENLQQAPRYGIRQHGIRQHPQIAYDHPNQYTTFIPLPPKNVVFSWMCS